MKVTLQWAVRIFGCFSFLFFLFSFFDWKEATTSPSGHLLNHTLDGYKLLFGSFFLVLLNTDFLFLFSYFLLECVFQEQFDWSCLVAYKLLGKKNENITIHWEWDPQFKNTSKRTRSRYAVYREHVNPGMIQLKATFIWSSLKKSELFTRPPIYIFQTILFQYNLHHLHCHHQHYKHLKNVKKF